MGKKKKKGSSRFRRLTEADLEVAISNVLRQAFPGLSADDIRHQRTFRIRLGRKKHDIKSDEVDWAAGRCDLLITKGDRPLAILELKRPDLALTDDDTAQGLSYARLLENWAPLVVVSNQRETRIFETFGGVEWKPQNRDEASLSELLKSSATLATTDLRNAVETLLGSNKSCWTSVVRSFTRDQLEILTGDWDDLLAPFPRDLILPRKATAYLAYCLAETVRVPFIVGPPLSGKSNVLREFIRDSADSPDLVALYLDADSSGHGIFQTIANLMTRSLGWDFDANQARAWLQKLSHSKKRPRIVVMVDGASTVSLKGELDELVSSTYGSSLRLVVSIDQGMAKELLKSKSGRQRTALGQKAAVIQVEPLDDEEFDVARATLDDHRIAFFHGSHRAAEYRIPWLLRSIVAMISKDSTYADVGIMAAIPSIAGRQPLAFAEERFGGDAEMKGQFLRVATALLADAENGQDSLDFSLLLSTTYICRFETLQRFLGDAEISDLMSKGYLKHHILGTHRIVVPQLPTLVAACAAQLIAETLENEITADPICAADHLVAICNRLPFGEVIGAEALCRAAWTRGMPLAVAERLIERSPRRQAIPPGSKTATMYKGSRIDIEVVDERRFVAVFPNGARHEFSSDPDDSPAMAQVDMMGWLILSHFAAIPIAIVNAETEQISGRLDTWVQIEVGCCKVVLKRPEGDSPDKLIVHEIGNDTVIVCHVEGIIEPITHSLMLSMSRDQELAEAIVGEAKERKSLPLLSRISVALMQIEEQADAEKAAWASRLRRDEVVPAFRGTVLDH